MENRDMQEQFIAKYLRIIFKVIQAHSKIVECSCGLSTSQLWMLHAVAASPGIKVSDLADTLSIHRSTCSNMLDKLEDKGLTFRDRSKTDQRTVHLFVTEQGTNLLLQSPSPPQQKINTALQRLSSEQLSGLEKNLKNLVDYLQQDEKFVV